MRLKPWISMVFGLLACGGQTLFSFEDDLYDLSLDDLQNIEVTSSSRIEQKSSDVQANLSVITASMIRKRGYQNLVQILEDIPGFDFATGEDGGGEYTTHSIHRGIGGDNGNSKILIMVNGVVQNFINNNWSTLWTNEMMLASVKRIEIIQGPGAVIYGSNAVSGIIHFIMNEDFSGAEGIIGVGEHGGRQLDARVGRFFRDLSFQMAFHYYESEGDGGDRYDPGGYYHNNVVPNLQTESYDAAGVYQSLGNPPTAADAHPEAGRILPDGFDVSKEDFSIWTSFDIGSSLKLEGFYWEKKDGLGSYVPGYEYYTNDPSKLYQVHMKGYHVSAKSDQELSKQSKLSSQLVYRVTEQSPDTGFQYTYRFNGLNKTYHSHSSQVYLEEVFSRKFDDASDFVAGLRFTSNQKMPQIVSLGREQDADINITDSSWDEADAGNGLNRSAYKQVFRSQELALFSVYEKQAWQQGGYSLGLRYDLNDDEYGRVFSPRLGLDHRWNDYFSTKFMYGEAFRQPSNFEYYDEFRGNQSLRPEKISSYELENQYYRSNQWLVKTSMFYSNLKDEINVINQKYENSQRSQIAGLALSSEMDVNSNLKLFINGIWTQGKKNGKSWNEMEHVAEWKANLGINWLTWQDHLNVNLRCNYVGSTLAPTSNTYIWRNHGGKAPAFTKFNLTLTLKKWIGGRVEPQLIVRNLFDEHYFTLGRQDGRSDIVNFNSQSQLASEINPLGFTPAYHPQQGRTVFLNCRYRF